MIAGYDAWKTRAPEDEPGYSQAVECGDYYHDHQCLDCGDWSSVCAACQLCSGCHREIDPDEARTDMGLDED